MLQKTKDNLFALIRRELITDSIDTFLQFNYFLKQESKSLLDCSRWTNQASYSRSDTFCSVYRAIIMLILSV